MSNRRSRWDNVRRDKATHKPLPEYEVRRLRKLAIERWRNNHPWAKHWKPVQV